MAPTLLFREPVGASPGPESLALYATRDQRLQVKVTAIGLVPYGQ